MFASTELASRIDRVEARLTEAIGRVAVANDSRSEAFVEILGDGVVAFTAPESPMNKMIGVGWGSLPEPDRLDAVEAQYELRQSPLQAEVSTLADRAFAATLSHRGYVLEGFENVLGRPLVDSDSERDPNPGGAIAITSMAEHEAERWLDVAAIGFLQPDAQGVQAPPAPARAELKAVLRDFMRVPGFRRYCAWIDGELAGIASLRLDSGIAQLCGAATLPDLRRRGVQTALLRHRLFDARRAGCDLAVMTTQPGSKSQENGHKQSFSLLYGRALLVKHPDAPRQSSRDPASIAGGSRGGGRDGGMLAGIGQPRIVPPP